MGLYDVCAETRDIKETPDEPKARAFFERNFRPVRIAPLGESQGFLTAITSRSSKARAIRATSTNFRCTARAVNLVVAA